MTLGEALRNARARLARAGVPAPDEEAERLAAACLGCGRADLFLSRDVRLEDAARRALESMLARRERREPLAYVLGSWPFLDLDLRTDARALVPRPETEDVALEALRRLDQYAALRRLDQYAALRRRDQDAALTRLDQDSAPTRLDQGDALRRFDEDDAPRALPDEGAPLAVDVGTGSGCLALALAAARPALRVVALDSSRAALTLAEENARANGLEERVAFVEADLVEPLRAGADAALVVANLPYVSEDELDALEPEIVEHEPRSALVAAGDGLAAIAALVAQAPQRLAPGGWLVLEIAPQRDAAVRALLDRPPWRDAAIVPDRFGRPRVALARMPRASEKTEE